ncbi:hypothetical protein ACFL2A_01370 [Thermodesulfobacteriota bacterium]
MLNKAKIECKKDKDKLNCDIKSTLDHIIRNKLLIVRFKLTNIGLPKRAVVGFLVFIEGVLEKLYILH